MQTPVVSSKVECIAHGPQPLGLVCTHIYDALSSQTVHVVGFQEYEPTTEDPEPVALCGDCESFFRAEGVWTDLVTSQVKLRMLCLECFGGARRMAAREAGGHDA
jgi:hypothetical protein